MSDIHGRYNEYSEMLKKINFERFSMDDKVYILGDVIDRGPDGVKILQHIMEHPKSIELLMGNHERMMLDAVLNEGRQNDAFGLWMYNGGRSTYEAYNKLSKLEQSQLINFLSNLPYSRTIRVGFKVYELVHSSPLMSEREIEANMRHFPSWAINMSAQELMLWLPMSEHYILGNKVVVFGHRCTKLYQSGKPYRVYKNKYMVGIDCGCSYKDGNGRLGCLRLDDGAEYYVGFSVM